MDLEFEPWFRLAVSYPYARPTISYVHTGGRTFSCNYSESEIRNAIADKIAVLAVGSNNAPSTLVRKFAPSNEPILALVSYVDGYDSVYGARVSSKGLIPATLVEAPATTLVTHTLFLSDAQLAVLDASETLGVAYDRVTIDVEAVRFQGVREEPDLDLDVSHIYGYVCLQGPLHFGKGPVALSSLRAQHRRTPAVSEREVLAAVSATNGLTAKEFVARAIQDASWRQAVTARLGSAKLAFSS